MEDLGARVAYAALPDGVAVYDRERRMVGTVEHVLTDDVVDVFHGLIVCTTSGDHRFAARRQIAEVYERGVLLGVGADDLLQPSRDEVAAEATANDESNGLLRRAWEWLNRPQP